MSMPIYTMAAAPCGDVALPGFFESGSGPVPQLLASPKSFRYAGWDLQTGQQPRIVDADHWEVAAGHKVLQIYEDGTLIAKVSAGAGFLSWPLELEEFLVKPRLNPLALIEVTTSFVYTCKEAIELLGELPSHVKFVVGFDHVDVNGAKLFLPPYSVKSRAWSFERERPEISATRGDVQIDAATLVSDPDAAAYRVVQVVYRLFGLTADKIPYVTEQPPRRINVAEFLK